MYTQYLSKAFADAGYAVFAPNHRDNVCTEPMKRLQHPAHQFNDPMRWTDTTYADRRKDMETVLNTLSKDKAYAMLDWDKVAAAGHSLGGYTALGIAGAWPAWKDPRIKAVLALSPYSTPFIFQRTIKNVTVPVMYQGGTRDTGITPYLRKSGGAYDQSHTPKFFLELEGAEHAAWSYSKTPYAQTIEAYSIAFLDAEFKKKTFPKSLMKSGGQVKTIRVDQQ